MYIWAHLQLFPGVIKSWIFFIINEALMFTLICVWINGWVNNREAGDLRPRPLWRQSNGKLILHRYFMGGSQLLYYVKSTTSARVFVRYKGKCELFERYLSRRIIIHILYPWLQSCTDSKIHGANMGPTCRTQMGPCWPHEPCYQGVFSIRYIRKMPNKEEDRSVFKHHWECCIM